jgi:hypothetical protein
MEVSHGGYAEPVRWRVLAPAGYEARQASGIPMGMFELWVKNLLDEWDVEFSDFYGYVQPDMHSSVPEDQLSWPKFRLTDD